MARERRLSRIRRGPKAFVSSLRKRFNKDHAPIQLVISGPTHLVHDDDPLNLRQLVRTSSSVSKRSSLLYNRRRSSSIAWHDPHDPRNSIILDTSNKWMAAARQATRHIAPYSPVMADDDNETIIYTVDRVSRSSRRRRTVRASTVSIASMVSRSDDRSRRKRVGMSYDSLYSSLHPQSTYDDQQQYPIRNNKHFSMYSQTGWRPSSTSEMILEEENEMEHNVYRSDRDSYASDAYDYKDRYEQQYETREEEDRAYETLAYENRAYPNDVYENRTLKDSESESEAANRFPPAGARREAPPSPVDSSTSSQNLTALLAELDQLSAPSSPTSPRSVRPRSRIPIRTSSQVPISTRDIVRQNSRVRKSVIVRIDRLIDDIRNNETDDEEDTPGPVPIEKDVPNNKSADDVKDAKRLTVAERERNLEQSAQDLSALIAQAKRAVSMVGGVESPAATTRQDRDDDDALKSPVDKPLPPPPSVATALAVPSPPSPTLPVSKPVPKPPTDTKPTTETDEANWEDVSDPTTTSSVLPKWIADRIPSTWKAAEPASPSLKPTLPTLTHLKQTSDNNTRLSVVAAQKPQFSQALPASAYTFNATQLRVVRVRRGDTQIPVRKPPPSISSSTSKTSHSTTRTKRDSGTHLSETRLERRASDESLDSGYNSPISSPPTYKPRESQKPSQAPKGRRISIVILPPPAKPQKGLKRLFSIKKPKMHIPADVQEPKPRTLDPRAWDVPRVSLDPGPASAWSTEIWERRGRA